MYSSTVLQQPRYRSNLTDILYIYIKEVYLAIKKNEMMPFGATWMDLEMIILSEVNQRERQISHDKTYMWNLSTHRQTFFQNRKILTDIKKQTYGEGGEGYIKRLGLTYIYYYI